ncbi:hypothetical protein [Methanoregula formicica]|uniref:hypothetical protein n=1 Tax=Methanoregula formicica TaxID=882104 RepID=UPI00064F2B9A|nr:hypothetical protein [Methanoregula formicica]
MFKTKWGLQKKILLKNVKDIQGRYIAQHISLSELSDVRVFEGFCQSEVLQLSAIVYSYVKGYSGENIDLKLARPWCIDYGFHDVRDLTCISSRSYRKKEVNAFLMQELNIRKKNFPRDLLKMENFSFIRWMNNIAEVPDVPQ